MIFPTLVPLSILSPIFIQVRSCLNCTLDIYPLRRPFAITLWVEAELSADRETAHLSG